MNGLGQPVPQERLLKTEDFRTLHAGKEMHLFTLVNSNGLVAQVPITELDL